MPSSPHPARPSWVDVLDNRSPEFLATIAGLTVLVLGVLNALIDAEVTFSVFYLLPIGLVSWYISRTAGVAYSVLCAGIWLMARLETGAFYARAWMESWDALVRFGLFLCVALLLSALRAAFDRERSLARTDPVTGVRNSRAFREAAEREIARAQALQRAYTLAYLDLDNFKGVNDRLGHAAGDELLRAVSGALVSSVRQTDLVARLGGDEFALLLPDTEPAIASDLLERLRAKVHAVTSEVACPVTFSIGAMSCRGDAASVDELLHAADELMYRVKHSGKNAVAYAEFTRRPAPLPTAVPA
jgi:diguanylate cyclase (GGDEF)-like protein